MTTSNSLERFLEVEFQAWGRRDDDQKRMPAGPVITISREPGCDGEHVAHVLAQELGLDLYDRELVEAIAKDAHVSEQVVATLDETVRSELDDWLSGCASVPALTSGKYLHALRRVLFAIAAHGNAVIIGRCANFLLPTERKTLGLCLVAPLEVRTNAVMRQLKGSSAEARTYIARVERERRQLVRKMSHADIDDVANYHLVINTAWVSTETIVRIVKQVLRTRPGGETSGCDRTEVSA